MDNKKFSEEWFLIADADLGSAAFLQNMKPIPIEIICYHCQQSAEKFLKGFLASMGVEIAKTHDLPQLNIMCKALDEEFTQIEGQCLRLTDFGVMVRYPYPIDINFTDMEIALRDANEIKRFVSDKIE